VSKKKAKIQLIILSIFIALFGVSCVLQFPAGDYDYKGFAHIIKLGLDLKGGVYAVFDVTESDATETAVNATIDNLQRMLSSKGYTEANVVRQGAQGNYQIRVEVPDVEDPQTIFDLIGNPAYLEFKIPVDEDPDAEPYITGKHVTDAYAGFDPETTAPVVVLKLNAEGAELFKQATTDRQGNKIGIYVNGKEIASPNVESIISNGTATITGVGDYTACQALALQIQSGSFSVTLETVENRVISPTLGVNAITMSVIAGAIGILLIVAFMLFFYRLLGAAASVALSAYVVLTIMVLGVFPWVQLSLSGIGGIVLGIGMAVDANIIIFERIKDEYEKGKPIPASVNIGFKRAARAIIDSNITTIIGALALLLLGPASLQSFAVTLMISIVLSLFTALVLTRRVVKLFLVLNNKNAKLYNLRTENDGFGKLHNFVEKVKNFKITEKYKKLFIAPAAAVLIAVVMFAVFSIVENDALRGMNLGIDFTGGTILSVDLSGVGGLDVNDDAVYGAESEYIRGVVTDEGYRVSLIQRADGNVIQVRYQNDDADGNDRITAALYAHYGEEYGEASVSATDFSTYFISASARSDLLLQALGAVAVALLATLLYIAFRFKLRYGLAAVLALIHDVILLVSLTVIFRIPVNASFIAALVTIIGYAINDVIVIFDRVRENISLLENKSKYDPFKVANVSIGETATRTLYTTVTTLITIVMLAILGGSTMSEFALPIIIGLLVGFYSSLFVAPSIWALFIRDEMKRAAVKKRANADISTLSSVEKMSLAAAGTGGMSAAIAVENVPNGADFGETEKPTADSAAKNESAGSAGVKRRYNYVRNYKKKK
jgi:SecD/SecF fusion protein